MPMIDRTCQHCLRPFKAHSSNVARGWGRFCSKSCKAAEQEWRTGAGQAALQRRRLVSRNVHDRIAHLGPAGPLTAAETDFTDL